jgi:uncharacterized membrane protein YukC
MADPGGDDIFEHIVDAMAQNGAVKEAEYRRMVLLALVALGNCAPLIRNVQKEVEELKRNSIMLLAKRHSKIAWTIAIGFTVLTVATILHLGLDSWLFELFNIPALPTAIP